MKRNLLAATALSLALTASAFAADLPSIKAPVVIPPPPTLWTGFYAGLNAGYSLASSSRFHNSAVPLNDTLNDDVLLGGNFATAAAASAWTIGNAPMSGFIGGGQIGYNYQLNQFVVGLEADIQGSGINGEGTTSGAASAFSPVSAGDISTTESNMRRSVDWLGTARGRVGWLFAPNLLVFASGGVAYGGVSAKTNQLQSWSGPGGFPFGAPGLASSVAVGEQRTVKTGWTAGAGVEWMITPNWSLKAEYLYFDLGSIAYASSWANTGFSTFPVTAGAPTLYAAWHQTPRFDGHILRAGVNYHFNWGAPAAVLAKF